MQLPIPLPHYVLVLEAANWIKSQNLNSNHTNHYSQNRPLIGVCVCWGVKEGP